MRHIRQIKSFKPPLVVLTAVGAFLTIAYSTIHFLTPPKIRPKIKRAGFVDRIKVLKKNRLLGTGLDLLLVACLISYSLWHVFGVKGAAACPVTDGGAGDADSTVNGTIVIGSNTTWTAQAAHLGVIDCTGVNITVNSGVTLTFNMANDGDTDYTEDYGLTLQTDGLIVEGTISANGTGYAGGTNTPSSDAHGKGPGGSSGYTSTACSTGTLNVGGASHGGLGGFTSSPEIYGSVINPTTFGSGSGRTRGPCATGSNGGGAIHIIADSLSLNGSITANGANGTNSRSGGGSGGSLWLQLSGQLSGSGNIHAKGGDGGTSGGAGGGGRIAVYYSTSSFSGEYDSSTGTVGTLGTDGSLIVVDTTQNSLLIPQSQRWIPTTASSFVEWFPNTRNVTVNNNATLTLESINQHLTSGGAGWTFSVDNFTVESGSTIHTIGYNGGTNTPSSDAHGKGPGGSNGYTSTACSTGTTNTAGGSYGGVGGLGGAKPVYGSETYPTEPGSGSGRSQGPCSTGASGGGAIHIITTEDLDVSGSIDSDGEDSTVSRLGGGSGGSVLLEVNGVYSGNGTINAIGGDGGSTAGSGGGGRIAVYYVTGTFGGTYNADGGATGTPGAEGTIYTSNIPSIVNTYQFQSDNTTQIATGSATPEREINLRLELSDEDTSETLTPYVELRPKDTPFKDVATYTLSDINHSGGIVQTTLNISDSDSIVNVDWHQQTIDFSKRIELTIDNSNSAVDLSSFPVLVKLNSSRIDYSDTKDSGEDIRFTDSSGNLLSYEIEKWNESGDSYIWVKVPSIAAGSTTEKIYMYYKNSGATDGQNPESVWNSNYKAVWHFNESSGDALDSTSNGNDLTANGSFTYSQTGAVGNTYNWSGNDYLRRSMTSPGLPVTIEFYANPNSSSPVGIFDSAPANTNVLRNYEAGVVEWHDNNPTVSLGLSASTWTHLAFVYKFDTARRLSWYKNGVFQATANGNTTNSMSWNSFTLGNINTGSAGWYSGYLDEVRISNTERSADWIEATHLSSQDSLLTYGTVEDLSQGQSLSTLKLSDNTDYHWQARVCDSLDNCSPWTQFGDNAEGVTDFSTRKMVGYWNFDEGKGDTANDNAGNNDGNLAGSGTNCPQSGDSACPTWTTSGKINGALNFDTSASTDDYVLVGNSSSLNNLDNFSVSLWVNLESTGASQVFVNKTNALLYIDSGGVFNSFFGGSACSSNATLSTGNWYNLMTTYDGTNVYLYVNGVLKSTCARTATTGTADMYIGSDSTPSQYTDAVIDEVKFFADTLSSDEILVNYASGGINFGAGTREDDDLLDTAGNPPVAHWSLDEQSGTSANDISDNENTGTLGGDGAGTDVPSWKHAGACKIGPCLEFDGSNDFVSVPNNASLDLDDTDNFTVMTWLKAYSWDTSHGLLCKRNAFSTSDWCLFYNTVSDELRLNLGESAADEIFDNDNVSLSTNTWHHVALTKSGTNYNLFVDGSLATTGTSVQTWTDSENLTIGNVTPSSSNSINGLMDDIKIYNYARTPAQIAYDYNRSAPVAHWKMDDNVTGNGQTIIDALGSNNGTTDDGANDTGMDCTVQGKRNLGCQFDGVDDFIDVGDTGSTGIRTLSFWTKPTSTTQELLQLSATDTVEVSSGAITVGGFGTETVYVDGKVTTSFPDTNWHHITVISDTNITANDLEIGRISTNYGAGIIDDVKIYNYTLSPDQIKKVINEGAVRFGPSEGSP